jgi:peptide/nickel transport system ATP-binding protein
VQMVFQDPFASLNPRMRVGDIIAEPLVVHDRMSRSEARSAAGALLERVGLPADAAARYPHEFSGGQRQRIGIARALAPKPDLIIADEPVSALDVSIQAQLLNLLKDLQRDLGLSMLFISHDLNVVHYMCTETVVMLHGVVVEHGPTDRLWTAPEHEYTRTLLSAIPHLERA